jgi:hypothetical protein
MLEAVGGPNGKPDSFCHACFSGQYAVPFTATSKRQTSLRLIGV